MRKRKWLPAICLGLLGFVIGGFAFRAVNQTPSYIPPLKIVGDVTESVTLENPNRMARFEKISYDGKKYRAIKLVDIISKAKPVGKPCQLYLVGSDGFTSSFKAERLEKCYIAFTAQNGWEAINLKHPVNSNTKALQEIIVVSDSSDGSAWDFAFTVINQDTELVSVTPGQLHTRALTEYPYPEGTAAVENEGQTYETSVYTKRKVFPLSDLTPAGEEDMILVVGAGGEHRWVENRGCFELKENHVNYLQINERSRVEKVKGVIINPPATAITDTYYDARHFLESGARVLVLVLDGFNYRQYAYAVDNGYAPFLKKTGKAVKATGVYPPADNVWLAAMVTGKPPEENGIITGNAQDLKVPSLFAVADKLQKKALLLQAGQKTLNTETEPVLCSDENANATADDELYTMTLANMDKDYDLLMVRFQDIAANGERYGRTAAQTMDAVAAIDRYLEEIVNRWPGKVIVTAGAGTQPGDPAGAHGEFSCETMFAPYWRLR